jgi:hypothetical protein
MGAPPLSGAVKIGLLTSTVPNGVGWFARPKPAATKPSTLLSCWSMTSVAVWPTKGRAVHFITGAAGPAPEGVPVP